MMKMTATVSLAVVISYRGCCSCSSFSELNGIFALKDEQRMTLKGFLSGNNNVFNGDVDVITLLCQEFR